jgi:hypothetical protein
MRMRPSLLIRVVAGLGQRVDPTGAAAAVLNAIWFSVMRTGACFRGVQAAVGGPDSVAEVVIGVGVTWDMAVLL